MAKVQLWRFSVAVVLAGAILPVAAGETKRATGANVQKKLVKVAEMTVEKGKQAKLPPHLSTLLGLTREQESPVIQSVVRGANTVQGFDVSVANKNDIVLFVVDESARNQSLYLTSPQGTLRKLVLVKAGIGDVALITEKDRQDFEKAKQFWLDQVASGGAGK